MEVFTKGYSIINNIQRFAASRDLEDRGQCTASNKTESCRVQICGEMLEGLEAPFLRVIFRGVTFLANEDFVDMVSTRCTARAGTQMLEHLSPLLHGCGFWVPFQETDEGLDLHLYLYDDEHLGHPTYIGSRYDRCDDR